MRALHTLAPPKTLDATASVTSRKRYGPFLILSITIVLTVWIADVPVPTGATRSAHVDGTFAASHDTVRSLASMQTFEGDLAKGTRKDLFLMNAVRAVGSCK